MLYTVVFLFQLFSGYHCRSKLLMYRATKKHAWVAVTSKPKTLQHYKSGPGHNKSNTQYYTAVLVMICYGELLSINFTYTETFVYDWNTMMIFWYLTETNQSLYKFKKPVSFYIFLIQFKIEFSWALTCLVLSSDWGIFY